jgi:hypothetical protein
MVMKYKFPAYHRRHSNWCRPTVSTRNQEQLQGDLNQENSLSRGTLLLPASGVRSHETPELDEHKPRIIGDPSRTQRLVGMCSILSGEKRSCWMTSHSPRLTTSLLEQSPMDTADPAAKSEANQQFPSLSCTLRSLLYEYTCTYVMTPTTLIESWSAYLVVGRSHQAVCPV